MGEKRGLCVTWRKLISKTEPSACHCGFIKSSFLARYHWFVAREELKIRKTLGEISLHIYGTTIFSEHSLFPCSFAIYGLSGFPARLGWCLLVTVLVVNLWLNSLTDGVCSSPTFNQKTFHLLWCKLYLLSSRWRHSFKSSDPKYNLRHLSRHLMRSAPGIKRQMVFFGALLPRSNTTWKYSTLSWFYQRTTPSLALPPSHST